MSRRQRPGRERRGYSYDARPGGLVGLVRPGMVSPVDYHRAVAVGEQSPFDGGFYGLVSPGLWN